MVQIAIVVLRFYGWVAAALALTCSSVLLLSAISSLTSGLLACLAEISKLSQFPRMVLFRHQVPPTEGSSQKPILRSMVGAEPTHRLVVALSWA